MAWQDRLREAAYTPPSGTRLTFLYENVSRELDKKTTAFEFPDADGTFVQDKGVTGRRYPLRVFFSGDDHDQEADAFLLAISEAGEGRLEHPLYGTVNVVPFGKIAQRDDLKTAANQTVMQVTFFDTIGVAYPTGQADPASQVLTAVEEFNAAIAQEFEDTLGLATASERGVFRNQYQSLLATVSSGLSDIADTQGSVRTQFNAVVDSINQGIDVLVSEPLTLAFQTSIAIQSPARALTAVQARLDAYANLVSTIISGNDAVAEPGGGGKVENAFRTSDLYASGYVTGSIISVVNTEFSTKTDALQAAEGILQQLTDVTDWKDQNLQALSLIDTGGAYQQLQEAAALCAGFLIEISFSLKQERSVILDRDRTIIDLAAELYGSVDDQLDFLIDTNNLSGDEHIEVLMGREIVFYV